MKCTNSSYTKQVSELQISLEVARENAAKAIQLLHQITVGLWVLSVLAVSYTLVSYFFVFCKNTAKQYD